MLAPTEKTFSVGKARVFTGVIGLVLTVVYVLLLNGLPFGRPNQPGPAVFPAVVSVVMLIASVITIWDGFKILREADEEATIPEPQALLKILSLLAILIFYAMTLRYLGRVISTYIVVTALIAIFIQPRSVIWPFLHAAWITFSIWLLFVRAFGVPLPRGVLINL